MVALMRHWKVLVRRASDDAAAAGAPPPLDVGADMQRREVSVVLAGEHFDALPECLRVCGGPTAIALVPVLFAQVLNSIPPNPELGTPAPSLVFCTKFLRIPASPSEPDSHAFARGRAWTFASPW